ncbi:hypothetical protein, partial [Salmonella enterica]|uniref:hypothetical protein n=1 Tax=Salmonella enterica TaxID=28901 RepID=UPI00398C7489
MEKKEGRKEGEERKGGVGAGGVKITRRREEDDGDGEGRKEWGKGMMVSVGVGVGRTVYGFGEGGRALGRSGERVWTGRREGRTRSEESYR